MIEKIKLRTKIEVILIVIVVLILAGNSFFAITRTITDSSDTIDAYIRNSNGNYWEATGSNIQVAINDLRIPNIVVSEFGIPHGTVWLPGVTTLNISSTITIEQHVTLDMGGCTIQPDSNIDIFKLRNGAQIRNGVVNVSGIASYDKSVITFNASESIGMAKHHIVIENLRLVSGFQNGTAIYFNVSSSSQQVIACVHIDNVYIDSFEYGILVNHTSTAVGDNSYINGNYISNIYISNTTYCLKTYIDNNTYETGGNYYSNIYCYCTNYTECIIWHEGYNLTGMNYNNIQAYNWNNNSGLRTSYNLTSRAMLLFLMFSGGGEDIALPAWGENTNAYMVINCDNSTLMLGDMLEYNP